MAIVATEIESVHGAVGGRHMVFYRCQDSDGIWHSYGPVHAAPNFDANAHMSVVAEKVATQLAQAEIAGELG